MFMSSDKILGIDLGTTNSGMAIIEAGDAQMLANMEGDRLTSSVVHYDEDGNAQVGPSAIKREPAEPEQVVREIKRHMGEDDYREEIAGNEFTPEEVSSETLSKLKSDAEEFLGDEVEEAVVTVPAYFTIDQTTATREAAELAGFEDIQLLNEPTAAAVAYGTGKSLEETLLVYDFGGGTLDISLIEVDGEAYNVLATDGDNKLGGADFDRALMEFLADSLEDEYGEGLLEDEEIRANLRKEAEEAKIQLSSNDEVELQVPFLGQIEGEIVKLEETVTRETFEDETSHLRDQAIDPIQNALDKAEMEVEEIDTTLLVGGSTMMPAVQERLEEFVGVEPTSTLDPDKVVAQGAAIYTKRGPGTGYMCPLCGMIFDTLFEKNEHYDTDCPEREDKPEEPPTDEFSCPNPDCEETFDTKRDRQQHVAAEHEEGDDNDTVIKDILDHSLGTKLASGTMDTIIDQGTNREESVGTGLYTTNEDDQTVVPVGVYQGESEMAEDNQKIGIVRLKGVPPMPEGEPEIEVTYDYETDGTLHVRAVENISGETVEGDFKV